MNIKRIIGENVRGYRKKLGWTQEKMGVRGKLSPEYISSLENGKENPKAETLLKIAAILKIHPGLLFDPHSFKKE